MEVMFGVVEELRKLCRFHDCKHRMNRGVPSERHLWFHDYSFDSINSVLAAAGFKTKYVWNDLTGSRFTEGRDWIAIVTAKEKEVESK